MKEDYSIDLYFIGKTEKFSIVSLIKGAVWRKSNPGRTFKVAYPEQPKEIKPDGDELEGHLNKRGFQDEILAQGTKAIKETSTNF